VLARYASHMKAVAREEVAKLREKGLVRDGGAARAVRTWVTRGAAATDQDTMSRVLASSETLRTSVTMREELVQLWARSTLTTEQLTSQLKDWCERAEKSGVPPLADFSRRLRCYA
jgi:stearoyl-CoA desaturase (Delta-9 desaturase)